MVKYLKKSKMYKIVSQELPALSLLKNCQYKFYRGTEWISGYCDNYNCSFKLCSMGGGIWLHLVVFDEDDEVVSDQILSSCKYADILTA